MENKVVICSYCKTKNPEGAKHCMGCGKALLKKVLVKQCPECQSFFDKEDKHCGLCGNPLGFTEIPGDFAENAAENVGNKHENAIICRHCGSDNFEDFKFCSKCGLSLISSRKRFCSNCGTESNGISNTCSRCGASVIVGLKVTRVKTVVQKKPAAKLSTPTSSFVVLMLAALLVIFSFLPLFKFEAKILGVKNVDFKLNAYQTVALVFDNMQSKTEKELSRTKLYKELEDIADDLFDDISLDDGEIKIKASQRRDLSQYILKSYKLSLRSESSSLSASIAIASLAALTFIIASAIALLYALVSFLSHYIDVDDFSDVAMAAIFTAPFAAAASYLALIFSTKAGLIAGIDNALLKTDLKSPALWLSGILAAAFAIGKLVHSSIFRSRRFSIGGVICNFIVLVLSVLILFSTTATVLNITVDTKLNDSNKDTEITFPLTADFYEIFNGLNGKRTKEIKDILGIADFDAFVETCILAYQSYSKFDLNSGDGDSIVQEILTASLANNINDGILSFSATKIFILLTGVFAALTGAIALYYLANAEIPSHLIALSSVASALSALTALIYNAICVGKINEAFSKLKIGKIFYAEAGTGTTILFTLAAIMVVTSCIKRTVRISGSGVSDLNIRELQSIGKR